MNDQKFVKVSDLFRCETCYHTSPKGCALGAFACDLGGAYRPSMSLLPTLTVAGLRPHGCWNIVEIDKDSRRITIECSECGMVEEMTVMAYGFGHNFCHICGADMRGGGEDA